jgi:hypothetical protein
MADQRALIGTSLDQVSTNAMLGTLAFQDADGAYIETIRGATALEGFNKDIADTAVDVFVYDTSKDSDGGAWRYRTQHTSWYNETLNTSTRGARREFPAVAVIVTDSSYHIKIYDGDDPDMPLWMEFQDIVNGSGLIPSLSAKPDSIAALNGIIAIGNLAGTVNSGQAGVLKLNFIEDSAYRHMQSGSSTYNGKWIGGGLANRNTGTPTTGSWDDSVGYIVDNDVNDVAMTVLPNAPIDSTTGLPIPTIAVATDGGVSVIKDDGTVNSVSHAYGDSMKIDVDGDVLLATHNGPTSGQSAETFNLITLTQLGDGGSGPAHGDNAIGTDETYYGYGSIISGANYMPFVTPNFGITVNPIVRGNDIFFGDDLLIHIEEDRTFPANGMSNYITSDYNTGWMHGDCKGAFLSDTDDTDVTGTELWPEGDFADANEWSSAAAQWTISGGTATVNYTGGGYSFLGSSTTTLTNGKKYILSFTISNYGAGGRLEAGQANSGNIPIGFSANGSYTQLITYTGTTGYGLGMYAYGGGTVNFTLDNLFLRELEEEDRSVNNTGLTVYGTITKTPVATGAELVGYSGWSSSNKLIQPHDSYMDFGTGDITMMGWFYLTTYQYSGIAEYGTPGLDENGTVLLFLNNDGQIRFLTRPDGTFNWLDFYSGDVLPQNSWQHVCALRRSGGSKEMYFNGNLVATGTDGGVNVTNFITNTQFSLGHRIDGSSGGQALTGGSISLFRVSASAPSAEQIKKIYEDEKVLFQENAACTLYGSSDAVTALAYDDTTSLLHVGTSSGRSEFKGLRRVGNTTTAVTTAISASNGLVAEQ